MEALGIDIKLLIAQIINFALFFLILKKFIAKPFSKFLSEQKNQEKEKERILHELQEKEMKIQDEEKDILVKAKEEGLQIINESKQAAIKVRTDIITQAQNEALQMKAKMKKELEAERVDMHKEMKLKFIDTCMAMVKSVLLEFISEERQKEVIQHLFRRLQQNKNHEN